MPRFFITSGTNGAGSSSTSSAGKRKHGFALERAVFLTVLHRLFVSGSDGTADRWREHYAIAGLEGLDLHHLYRAMAWLGEELPEKEQDGPVCSEMWPGNTADVTTLIPLIDRLRRRFDIARVCVVADRGTISTETMAELETRRLLYILRVRERLNDLQIGAPGRSPAAEVHGGGSEKLEP